MLLENNEIIFKILERREKLYTFINKQTKKEVQGLNNTKQTKKNSNINNKRK